MSASLIRRLGAAVAVVVASLSLTPVADAAHREGVFAQTTGGRISGHVDWGSRLGDATGSITLTDTTPHDGRCAALQIQVWNGSGNSGVVNIGSVCNGRSYTFPIWIRNAELAKIYVVGAGSTTYDVVTPYRV
jgi:hypothetical protein